MEFFIKIGTCVDLVVAFGVLAVIFIFIVKNLIR